MSRNASERIRALDDVIALIDTETDHTMRMALAEHHDPDTGPDMAAFRTGQLIALATMRTMLKHQRDRAWPTNNGTPSPPSQTRKEPRRK